jgi:exodeoxyribonuclease VII small subunit
MKAAGLVSDGQLGTHAMNAKSEKNTGFEQALGELEALIQQLESGELSLDQSLKQFKRGVELTRHCQRILDQAQQVVEQLIDPEDESSAAPFESND